MIDIPRDESGVGLPLPASGPARGRGDRVIASEEVLDRGGRATNPLLIVLAWAVVGVPLAWGVTQTVKTSLALFRSPPPAAAATH